MTTVWTTCRFCGGFKVPFGYVGDVIGSVCMCRFEMPAVLNFGDELQRITAERDALRAEVERLRVYAGTKLAPVARPLAEWHEDMGPVLWWRLPVDEPPWVGQPTDPDWPGYHTHWTKCVAPSCAAQEGKT